MDRDTQERLAAAGFRVGHAEDFLGLTDEERQLVELRLAVSRAVRRWREQLGVTQQQLADKLGSSQSRIAKIEAAAADVSLDLAFRALFAVGALPRDIATIFRGLERPKDKRLNRSRFIRDAARPSRRQAVTAKNRS